MGVMSAVMHEDGDAAAWLSSASALKERFNRDWWMADEQFFAVALDPDKKHVRAVTSNVGHCLATGIIDSQHRAAVVGRMFAPDMFSGWGIRTLSATHAFYNPLSYHRGTVWAVEQGTIIFGLRRFGFNARALDLTRALFELALLYPEDRIPERVGGLAPAGTLIVDPILPTWMPEIVVRDLRVGRAKVSLRFWRDDNGASKWEVLHKQGTIRVVRQPPPESRAVDVFDRAKGLLESIA